MAEVITVKTDRFECETVRFGDGEKKLVIIPGMSMKPISVLAQSVEDEFKAFFGGYTVFLIDRAENMHDGYTVEEMARDAAETMERLGIENAYVCGISQGGMIAEVLAAEYPSLVRKLVLSSTLARENKVSRNTFGTWARLGESGKVRELNADYCARIYEPEYVDANRAAFDAFLNTVTEEEAHRFAVLARACGRFDFYDRLGDIHCPTLVIGVRNDNVLSGDASVEIAEKIGCELYMYDRYGHAAYDIAPDFKKIFKKFFEKQ